MIYTKEEFKRRWDSNEKSDVITYNDIADCAKAWGLYSTPKICPIDDVYDAVLAAANCNDD
jgi:hypothetical protein